MSFMRCDDAGSAHLRNGTGPKRRVLPVENYVEDLKGRRGVRLAAAQMHLEQGHVSDRIPLINRALMFVG